MTCVSAPHPVLREVRCSRKRGRRSNHGTNNAGHEEAPSNDHSPATDFQAKIRHGRKLKRGR
jgi:hypothetical protein